MQAKINTVSVTNFRNENVCIKKGDIIIISSSKHQGSLMTREASHKTATVIHNEKVRLAAQVFPTNEVIRGLSQTRHFNNSSFRKLEGKSFLTTFILHDAMGKHVASLIVFHFQACM